MNATTDLKSSFVLQLYINVGTFCIVANASDPPSTCIVHLLRAIAILAVRGEQTVFFNSIVHNHAQGVTSMYSPVVSAAMPSTEKYAQCMHGPVKLTLQPKTCLGQPS